MRRVSRTTASRYGRALSSSMVGLSVPTVRSSFRSLVCASRCWVNAKSAQVVAELFKLETSFQKLGDSDLVVSFPATKNVGTSTMKQNIQ
jgi:hypothetical protein